MSLSILRRPSADGPGRQVLPLAVVMVAVAALLGGAPALRAQGGPADCEFVRGNIVNLEGPDAEVVVDLNDAVDLVAFLFIGRSVPASGCIDAADANDDGLVTMADYTYLVEFLYNEGPPPPAPFPGPGTDPTQEVTVPVEPDDRFSFTLGTNAAAAGNTGIAIPVTMSNAAPITGLTMVLGYDPGLLRVDEIILDEGTLLSAASADYITAEMRNAEGVTYIAALKDFATPFYFQSGEDRYLPAGDDQLVATLKCGVVVTAEKGYAPIAFVDGVQIPNDFGIEIIPEAHNLVFEGTTAFRPVLGTDGGIDVRGTFTRGDANRDKAVDIADPVFILLYIFEGAVSPSCFDAADANNDTRLNIADPIWMLNYLFQGGPQPSEPFPQPGVDPSDDGSGSMGCEDAD